MLKGKWQPFDPEPHPKLEDFLFGDPNGRHVVISAKDRNTAVWRFYTEGNSLKDFVPEKYLMTDTEGHWIGAYDSHAEMFIHQYSSNACVPVFVKDGDEWRQIEGIQFDTG